MRQLRIIAVVFSLAPAAALAQGTNTSFIPTAQTVMFNPTNGAFLAPTNWAEANDIARASESVHTTSDPATNYFWRNGGILSGQMGIATTDMVVFANSNSSMFLWPTNDSIDVANSFFTNGTAGGDLNTADTIYFYEAASDSWHLYYLYSPNRLWVDNQTQNFVTNLWIRPGQIFYYRNRATNDLHMPIRAWFNGNYISEQYMAGLFLRLMFSLDRREGGAMQTNFNFNHYPPLNLPLSNMALWIKSTYAPTSSTAAASNGTVSIAGTNMFLCYTNDWLGPGTNWLIFNGKIF